MVYYIIMQISSCVDQYHPNLDYTVEGKRKKNKTIKLNRNMVQMCNGYILIFRNKFH